MTWLAFGLDGKQVGALESAWSVGYRRFDCAASYGNTGVFSELLQREGAPRTDYHILYKVDPPQVGDLQIHIDVVAKRVFGGYVDQFLIHNVDSASEDAIVDAWKVMAAAKRQGLVKQIGVGNVRAPHAQLLARLVELHPIDVVENSLLTLLADPALKEVLSHCGPASACPQLFYYDVIKVAKDIGVLNTTGLKGLVKQVDALHFGGSWEIDNQHMILSSDKPATIRTNLESFGSGYEEDGTTSYIEVAVPDSDQRAITAWIQNASVVQESEPNPALSGTFRAWVLGVVEHSEAVRSAVQKSNRGARGWLEANAADIGLSPGQLDTLKIPAKVGMRRLYAGMPLASVFGALCSNKNCDWKWAIQLLQVLGSGDGDWDSFLRAGCPDVTF